MLVAHLLERNFVAGCEVVEPAADRRERVLIGEDLRGLLEGFVLVGDNELYELLVLFELAGAFARRSRRAVQRSGTGERRPLFVFELDDGRELELWYQSSHGLQPYLLTGIPDVVIRVGGRTILGDMKNYAPGNYTQAVYKMLGYLYNYGYPDRWADIDAGVLFFPEASPQHPGFRVLPRRRPAGAGTQQLMSLVVAPGGAGESDAFLTAFIDQVLRLSRAQAQSGRQ